MTLEELQTEWANDCQIDDLHPDKSSRDTPRLHSKYLNELMQYKLKSAKLGVDIQELCNKKAKYFRGHMTSEELKELGWEQWQYKTLKSEIPELVESDPEVIKLRMRESYLKAGVYFLESVLQEIRSRSFHVKNIITWAQFRAGA